MDKLTFAPIELTLYDDNDEAIKTHSRSIVRWGVLKQAIKLSDTIKDADNMGDTEFDAISAFVCRLFDNQFTREELENGADVGEIMACFRAVVNRANALGNA